MRPGPRRSLSHDDILEAAFEQLESKGFAATSVRGVAGSLGITPTAMYTYYPSKNALLRGMVEHLLARLELPETDAADTRAARENLVGLSLRLRELLVERPGAIGLLMSGPLDGPNAMRLNERLLESFTGAGLELDQAARAAYALQVFALGSIALQSAGVEAGDTHATSVGIALHDFPLSERTAQVVAQHDSREQFVWGIERLLDGLLLA